METIRRFLGRQPVLKPNNRLIKIFLLPALLMLGALGSGSCGGGNTGGAGYSPPPASECDLASQRDAQRRSGQKREDYYPRVFSSDFKKHYGADISPTEDDYSLARKASRSVFEIEFREGNNKHYGALGSGWLIAPRYIVTAAHNLRGIDQPRIFVHTFDGATIEAKKVYVDPKAEEGTDLALLSVEEEINAVPLKIADENPGKNEFLMAMGAGSIMRGLGGWTVSAGPALELKSGYTGCPVLNFKYENCQHDGCDTVCNAGRMYHAVPTAGGMSGGPIFNSRGEVVSLVSATRGGLSYRSTLEDGFGIMPFEVRTKPPENLWVYAFVQPDPNSFSYGPNPMEIKGVFDMIPYDEKPNNAGHYVNGNSWPEAGRHAFGDKYNPFPLDQFDHMQAVYKRAREATVKVRVGKGSGSGFIYDDNIVVTAGHVAPRENETAVITTEKGRPYDGRVIKTQYQESKEQGCDIAVIEIDDDEGGLSGYPRLEMADSSSLQCGDPLVGIGSAFVYNSVGPLQGVGAVYMRTRTYVSEFISHSTAGGMSGGPIVDKDGKVVSLSSTSFGRAPEGGKWIEPAPLVIHTRLPVYSRQDFSEGPRAETIKRFVEEEGFRCPP